MTVTAICRAMQRSRTIAASNPLILRMSNSKTALEHTVALLEAVFDMSPRNKKCEACSYDLHGAKRRHVRGPDSREGRFTLLAPGVGASTRNQWTG